MTRRVHVRREIGQFAVADGYQLLEHYLYSVFSLLGKSIAHHVVWVSITRVFG